MSSDTVIFTICARNYLGFAKTLASSLHEHHPDVRIVVWVLDEGPMPMLPDYLGAQFVPKIVGAPEWVDLSLYFNIRELATSVKPLCFLHHLTQGARRVVYLDPDIFVFRPLHAVFDLLDNSAQGVLTPHTLGPLPRDDAKPDDLELLGAGVFNLGFLAVANGEETDRILQWWAQWLQTHCFEDKATGTFTDQKWMNFAPVYCPNWSILRDTTYNVAYWNLPQRKLSSSKGGWTVDGQPLTFFHFSGFNPKDPALLSKHQTRITVIPGSPLAALLRFYARELLSAGYEEALTLRYPTLRFGNGVEVDDVCRRIYRDARRRGQVFKHPLAPTKDGLFAWCQDPIATSKESGAFLNRYLQEINAVRPDVVAAFPAMLGANWAAYVEWLHRSGIPEMGLIPEFLPKRASPPPAAKPTFGVRYVGYLSAHLGLGEAARGNILALRQQGIPTEITDVSYMTESDCAPWHPGDSGPRRTPAVRSSILSTSMPISWPRCARRWATSSSPKPTRSGCGRGKPANSPRNGGHSFLWSMRSGSAAPTWQRESRVLLLSPCCAFHM